MRTLSFIAILALTAPSASGEALNDVQDDRPRLEPRIRTPNPFSRQMRLPAPRGARAPAEGPDQGGSYRLTPQGQAIWDEALRRIEKGEPVDLRDTFTRLLQAERQNLRRHIEALSEELALAGGAASPWDAGRELWILYVGRYSEDPEGHLGLARASASGGDHAAAVAAYTQAMELGARSPEAHYQRGLSAERLGDFELAHADAGEALRLNPDDPSAQALFKLTEARVSRIRVDPRTGRLEEALGATQDGAVAAGASPPGVPELPKAHAGQDIGRQSAELTRRAQNHLQLGDIQAALSASERAARLDPRNAQAHNLVASARERLGDHAGAVASADRALALEPLSVPALNTRAWALSGMGRYREALEDARAIARLDPYDAFGRLNAARALGALDRRREMLQELGRAAALDARFAPMLERASRLPERGDTDLLFRGLTGGSEPSPRPAKPRRPNLLLMIASTLSGGLLIALGLLHGFSRRWRDRVRAPAHPRAPHAPPREGLRAYRLGRVIATGGMGVVYEAYDKNLNRKVAVKKLRGEIRDDPRERERFVREARTVAALSHPNIVQIHSVFEEGRDLYLVFEHVEGLTLRDALSRKGPLKLAEAARLLRGVCRALEYAHGRGVIHRDLKPSNIMLTAAGEVKVMDFGLARAATDAVGANAATVIWGTPAYMSPEAEAGAAGPEGDLYALGVSLYELTTGHAPFSGTPAAMSRAKAEGRFIPPSRRLRGLPEDLDVVVARALAPEVSDRFRSVAEFAAALKAIS